MKHTPGPWEVEQNHVTETLHGIWDKSDMPTYIARTCFAPNSEANAKLIAAAPEMLQALKNLLLWQHGTINHIQALKDAQSTIEKATL